ncbi:MAG: putative transport system ATP-binding protein [Campylobacterota bacterium]|nr:putative transport system ATP-binding protein [Campylobacterota bacterium]
MSFLKIKDISKIYGKEKELKTIALENINLDIKKGEFIVISGPSGSGKTTLLNAIGGLDSVSGGEIILNGVNLTDLGEHALSLERLNNIGFVFQAYNLIPVLNAKENIEYIMTLQGKSKKECEKRVLEVATELGIESLLNKFPENLSGGQQQRVAVARAVASRPELILADEPTANLDSKNAEDLMELMRELNEKENITIIFSSHDPMVISKAKRSIVLRDGKIITDRLMA